MRLTASVRHMSGSTDHFVVSTLPAIHATRLPPASRIEIVDADGGFLLVRYSASGEFAGDTWHATVDEAKRQALVEFQIEPSEWKEAEA